MGVCVRERGRVSVSVCVCGWVGASVWVREKENETGCVFGCGERKKRLKEKEE